MALADSIILLIEDNDDDADLTMRALRRHHVVNDVVRLSDGVDAIDYLAAAGAYEGRDRSSHPALILLDLKLPRRNGLDVLRAIKADPVHGHVPVVVLTSSVEERDLEEAYALGANSYVQKPVEFHQFSDAVAHIGLYWLLVNQRPPLRVDGT